MSLATLNGKTITRAVVQIPARGIWWADVTLSEEATISGAVKLVVADLMLSGTVVSGGPFRGASRYRIAAGAAGWGKTLKAKGYVNDVGVKLSTVLGDVSAEAGETLEAVPAETVGSSFAREEGPASRVLHQLASESWYVGEDGVTRLGRRPRVEIKTDATRIMVDLARGTMDLAADSIASILPGAVIDGLEVVDVQHELANRTLRTTVWGSSVGLSRRLAAFRRLVLAVLSDHRFRGVYEYRVVTQEGERLNLQAVQSSIGLPDLRHVRVRPGVPGCRADVALGSVVLVAFVNADPARPVVIAFEDAEGDGFAPDRLDLVGKDDDLLVAQILTETPGRVVRYGDPIQFPNGPGTVEAPTLAGSFSRVRA